MELLEKRSIPQWLFKLLMVLLVSVWGLELSAQNMSVNSDGAKPDASAMLDVKSNTRGFLMPRMNQSQRAAISTPAHGLMVLQINGNRGIYQYDSANTAWSYILDSAGVASLISSSYSPQDIDSVLSVGNNAQGDSIVNLGTITIGTTSSGGYDLNVTGSDAIINDVRIGRGEGNIASSTALGRNTLASNTGSGYGNTAVGDNALNANTTGHANTATGGGALDANTIGNDNTATGYGALSSNVNGSWNVAMGSGTMTSATGSVGNTGIGSNALNSLTTGGNNTALGIGALQAAVTGSSNVGLGRHAGFSALGDSNIFLGMRAGYSETGSNRLYIHNDSSAHNSLIYGEFDNQILRVNGELQIGNASGSGVEYAFPTTDGTNGQVMETDGAGNVTWATPSSDADTIIIDSDLNTSVAVSNDSTLFINNGVNTANISTNGIFSILNPGTSPDGSSIQLSSPSGHPGIAVFRGDGSGGTEQRWNMIIAPDSALKFYPNFSSTALALTPNQRVGIGTDSPTAKLDVEGLGQFDSLEIEGQYLLPTADGTNGQVMQTDGSGAVTWNTLPTANLGDTTQIADLDNDTKVMVDQGGLDDDTIRFVNAGTQSMTIAPNGNVGIGTTLPLSPLDISGDDNVRLQLNSYGTNPFAESSLDLRRARGTYASPTIVSDNDVLGRLVAKGYDGSVVRGAGMIRFKVDGTPASADMPGRIEFLTTSAGDSVSTVGMTLNNQQRLGIGTISPTALLDVAGGAAVDTLHVNGNFTLPSVDGTNGQVMQTDGSGTLSWATAADDGDWDTTATQVYTTKLVGIGQTNPTAPLQVESTPPLNANSGQILIGESTTSNTMFIGRTQDYGYVQSQNSEPLALNPLGNSVGIGTDSPSERLEVTGGRAKFDTLHVASTNPKAPLHINNPDWGWNGDLGDDGFFLINASSSAFGATRNRIGSWQGRNNIQMYADANGGQLRAYDYQNSVHNPLFLNAQGGRVGVGTTTPSAILDVEGGGEFDSLGIDGQYAFPTTDGSANQLLQTDGSGGVAWVDASTLSTGDTTQIADLDNDTKIMTDQGGLDDDTIRFVNAGVQSMAIAPNGNVGIGVLDPATELVVSSGNSGNSVLTISSDLDNNDENDNPRLRFEQDGGGTVAIIGLEGSAGTSLPGSNGNDLMMGTSGGQRMQLFTNSAIRMTVASTSGNVGIGTTEPNNYNLEVVDSVSDAHIEIRTDDAAGDAALRLSSVDRVYSIRSEQDDKFRIRDETADVTRIGIDTSGRVGIGTTSPESMLEVQGGGRFDSLIIDGQYYFPLTDGSAGEAIITDGAGALTWGEPTIGNMVDADNDTRIQVEESADEDIIRFDMEGTEYFRMDSGHFEVVNTGFSTFIGQGAGASDDFSSNQNTFIGYLAGTDNTTGATNVFVGGSAGGNNTTANANTMIGTSAGFNTTTGAVNTMVGSGSGYTNTSGFGNAFFGYNTGYANTTGAYNVFTGYQAGDANTVGNHNIFMGYQSGAISAAITGSHNIALGYRSGTDITTASNNVMIGQSAGTNTTTGGGNVLIGYQSGQTNTTGIANTFVGEGTGFNNTSNYNAFFGYRAGYNNTSGQYNTFSGYWAGNANTTGSNNVFLGYSAGDANTTANSNIFIGDRAGSSSAGITGGNNIAMGYFAGTDLTSGANNLMLGYWAGTNITSGQGNSFLGYQTGVNTTTGSYNTTVGFQAGRNISTATYNTMMGYQAGYSTTTGQSNTFIGRLAGYSNTTGFYSVNVGFQAGYLNTVGSYATNVGYRAGYYNTGGRNTNLGMEAGFYNTDGFDNVAIGYQAGRGVLNAGTNGSVYLGRGAGYNDTTDNRLWINNSIETATPLIWGDFTNHHVGIGTTTMLGSSALTVYENVTGYSGIHVGTAAGGEPYYGYAAGGTITGWTYTDGGDANKWKLNVASAVRMTVTTAGDVGIGTTVPSAELDVIGDIEIPAANDYTYATAKTHYSGVPASAINEEGGADVEFLSASGNYYYFSAGGTTTIYRASAPVNLPDGAVITGMNAYIYDNDGTYNVTVTLIRQAYAGTTSLTTGYSVTSTGSSTAVQNLSDTGSHTVDNSGYVYKIRFDARGSNSNMRFYNVRITYTVDQAD